MRNRARILWLFGPLVLACGCGGGTSQPASGGSSPGANPGSSAPTIAAISPNSAVAGNAAITLTINGTNFVADSTVNFGTATPTTTFVNSTQLTVAIPAAAIVSTGMLTVTVTNPAGTGGTSNPLTFTIIGAPTGSVEPQSIAVDPSGKFAYVADGNISGLYGYISMYTIDPTTGALASIGTVSSQDSDANSVSVDPSGKFAYVTNLGDDETSDGSVVMYTIDSAGSLTSVGLISGDCPGLCVPVSVVVHPSGKFAYVANGGGVDANIAMYTVNATTGVLTSEGIIPSTNYVASVAVHPSGKFAYAINGDGVNTSVEIYAVNTTTGILTSIGGATAEVNPSSVVVDPTGKFAYMTNPGSNDVSMCVINETTGVLTSIGTIAAGTQPVAVAVDSAGKFAYVTNFASNNVSMYTINATSGTLASIGTISAGLSPTSIAIHPSGKFAYVTNSGTSDVSIYSIDAATGALTLIGTTSI